MFQTQCLKIKLKPGTTDYVLDFIRNLDREEVYEVLRLETMVVETLFLERTRDADYLIMYAKAESLIRANEAMVNSGHPHFESLKKFTDETWGEITAFELLADYERIAQVE
ncbi:MAG: hypothetical protein HPY50_20760 [Firmicutes bacterium]|nr:hypothetical protein [Bacillota bacterium]